MGGTVVFHNLAGAGWGLAVTAGAGLYVARERRGWTTEAAEAREKARWRGCAKMNLALNEVIQAVSVAALIYYKRKLKPQWRRGINITYQTI